MNLAGLQRWMRRRRMAELCRELRLTAETTVLDVGGTAEIWALAPVRPRVTLLNQERARGDVGAAERVVLGDGTRLPFGDGAFDVVFSNSVIEHVGDGAAQRRFAEEVRRVGRRYWVQTPNRGFFLEQHLLTPFLHWLPRDWQRRLLPRFCVWRVLTGAQGAELEYYVRHYLDEIRLLRAGELGALFPDGRLRRERVLGLTKSLTVWRG